MGAFFANLLHLGLTAAPWLLLGLVIAGMVKVWLPSQSVAVRLAGSDLRAVTLAALVGAPLPLCSCGVLPTAFALRRAGASRSATTSFLVSTPETGVDSVTLSYALLGPFLAVARPVAAVLSAIFTGLLVGRAERRFDPDRRGSAGAGAACRCDASSTDTSARPRLVDGVRYAFTELLDDLAAWLFVGLVVAALVMTVLPPDALIGWGSGIVPMVLIVLISIPIYVCATAATPLAHAMLFAGVSPGTVLVFLLAGPATNFAGLLLIRRELGTATMWTYLCGVCVGSIVLGLATDLIWNRFGVPGAWSSVGEYSGERLPLWLTVTSLAILTIAAIRPLRRLLSSWLRRDHLVSS